MYALVYKERVIVGPIAWNRGMFDFALQKEGIKNPLIPKSSENNEPFIINEDAKIVPVMMQYENYNPITQYSRGPLWEIQENYVIAKYEAVDHDLLIIKGNLKNTAAAERFKKETKGIKITVQNNEEFVSTSRQDRNIFSSKVLTMSNDETLNWKFISGWKNLTKQEVLNIATSIDAYVQSTFDWEKTISDQIDQASTKEELLQIEIVAPEVPQE
jgi:hypothetical protein